MENPQSFCIFMKTQAGESVYDKHMWSRYYQENYRHMTVISNCKHILMALISVAKFPKMLI